MRTAEQFWSNVDQSGGPESCWPWQRGGRIHAPHGVYGGLNWQGRSTSAHRLAYELSTGAPATMHVLHTCDNPPCCNPAHLYDGDDAANVADREARRRRPAARGSAHGRATLTEDLVLELWRLRATGASYTTIAAALGCSKRQVGSVVSGETWGHVRPSP